MDIRRRFRLTLSLKARTYIRALLIFLVFGAAGAAIWMEANNQLVVDGQREMTNAIRQFDLLFNERSGAATRLGKWLVEQSEFVDLTAARDNSKLRSYIEPLTREKLIDGLTVADSTGLVLASAGKNSTFAEGTDIRAQFGVSEALSGKSPVGVHQDASGAIRETVLFPIKSGTNSSPVGILLVDQYLDQDFIQRVTAKSDVGINYFYADANGVSSFGAELQVPLKSALSAFLTPVPQGQPDTFRTLEASQATYLFKFNPFPSQDLKSSAVYGVVVPRNGFQYLHWNHFVTIGLVVLALLVGSLVASYLFDRRYAIPLQNLRQAVQELADGNQSAPLVLDRDPGGLGRQVERLHQMLLTSLQQVTQEKDFDETIIRSLGVAVLITDQANRIVRVNPTGERLLKQNGRDLLKQGWYDIFAECERTSEGAVQFSNGETSESDSGLDLTLRTRFKLRQDARVVLNVTSKQLCTDSRPVGYVHVLEDASEQEQFIRSKDEFIVNTAHELRGPLAALRVSIDALIEDQATLSKQELNFMLKNMQRAVVRFQGFAENLVDMGNIIAGRFMVRPFPVPFQDMVEHAVSQLTPLLEAREQFLETKIDDSVPYRVFADRPRVIQVLVNLLTNAIKYSPEGQTITLSVSTDDHFVMIEVTDRGPGIPLEEQPRIFERFFRGKRAMTEGAGLGLGMALSKEIVEAHGGRIGMNSQLDKGTTFWFSLLKA